MNIHLTLRKGRTHASEKGGRRNLPSDEEMLAMLATQKLKMKPR